MKRSQFTFYESFYLALRKLSNRDRVKVYDAICELALYGNEENLESLGGAVFEAIKPNIKSGRKKALAGKSGGEAKPKQNASKTGAKRKQEKEQEKEKDKEQMLKENIKRKVFKKPSTEEVAAYINERGSAVNPEAFMAHYESCGWKVGNKPMVDWKAAVRTWEHNNYGKKETKAEVKKTIKEQKATAGDLENMKRLIAEMRGEEHSA